MHTRERKVFVEAGCLLPVYFVNDFGSGRNRHLSDCLCEQILTGLNAASPLSWRGGGGGLRSTAIAVTPRAKRLIFNSLMPLLRVKCSQEVVWGHVECQAAKASALLVCLGAQLAGGSS